MIMKRELIKEVGSIIERIYINGGTKMVVSLVILFVCILLVLGFLAGVDSRKGKNKSG